MYLVDDGIHRCLNAWHLGKVTIRARLRAHDPPVEVPLTQIVSRKNADDVSPERLRHHLALARQGRTAAPISVQPCDDIARPEWAGYPVIPKLYSDVKILPDG